MPLGVAPVLEEERFGVFLTLTVTETSLCLGPSYQMIPRQVDLEILPNVAADLGLWAPRASVLLLSYSSTTQPAISVDTLHTKMQASQKRCHRIQD